MTLVLELTVLYMPAMIVKTFSMAMLLASLLAFGRLSSDSEVVALRAGGASLYRIMAPVAVYAFLVSVLTFAFNEGVVPPATDKATDVENQVAHIQTGGLGAPGVYPVVRNRKLVLSITASHTNRATGELLGVAAVAYDENQRPVYVLTAPLVKWGGPNDPKNFYIPEEGRFESLTEPLVVTKVQKGIWPGYMPPIQMPLPTLVTAHDNNYDEVSLMQLRDRINQDRQSGSKTSHDLADEEYGYWNKISVPLAALVFGCLGAVLGIRSHRTGTAAGMALAVAIIFGYFMLSSFMNVWALGGAIPPWVASFTPLAIGIVATVVIMKRRNI